MVHIKQEVTFLPAAVQCHTVQRFPFQTERAHKCPPDGSDILRLPLTDFCFQIFRVQAHHRRSCIQSNIHGKRRMHCHCFLHGILKFRHINVSRQLTAHRNIVHRCLWGADAFQINSQLGVCKNIALPFHGRLL